jgi:hypothetical protein
VLQATATGARDITRLELLVNDLVVGMTTSPDPAGASSLTASQMWRFEQAGPQVVLAVAYTPRDPDGVSTSVEVSVVDALSQMTPTVTSTPDPAILPDLLVSATMAEEMRVRLWWT